MKGRRLTAPPRLWREHKPLARGMRREATPAEALLWNRLRNRQVLGLKFRRQHPVGPYIVDSLCAERGLVVEVDGPVHDRTVELDVHRSDQLAALGLRVVRFRNEEVMDDMEGVLQRIRVAVDTVR